MFCQMGKDVVTFLSWAAEPEMEERKLVIPHLIAPSVNINIASTSHIEYCLQFVAFERTYAFR